MSDTFHRLADKAPDNKLQLVSTLKLHAEIMESDIRTALKFGDGNAEYLRAALYRLEEAVMWATKGLLA